MSARNATMSAKDASRSAKDATMSANDATRSAKAATSAADAGTSAASLKHVIANHKYSQAPHPPPLRKPSPSLVSRFQHKYPDYHLWENLVNPSIPKMEVLDACFLNCIKENVSQQYIFKTF